MSSVPTRSYSITLPYSSATPAAREHRREAERVRAELQDASITARQTLERADRWESNWTEDLDPSPNRVYRTSEAYGEKQSIAVETPDAEGPYQRPSKLVQEKEGKHTSTVLFQDGEVIRIDQLLHGSDGGTEKMTIEVNRDNNTVQYTIHETGQFALEPLGFPTSPSVNGGSGSPDGVGYPTGRGYGDGPDDVPDEFDNRRGYDGPDAVYNEWDTGRGSSYDGPDGSFGYDPYH